jgi:D-serine deaminase-like pyridoxal phosphate-dependent protein
MERPVFQPLGTLTEDLDTPALVVDLSVMEQNIETLHSHFRNSAVKVRPYVTSHQCPQIARRQLDAGGTVGGIAVAGVGEAEIFSEAGFRDLLVATQVVTNSKIRRLCNLARSNQVAVAVDNAKNAAVLSECATQEGVTLNVLVEVEAGLGRCGVPPGSASLELARAITSSPGLEFAGLMAIPPVSGAEAGLAVLEVEALGHLQPVVDTRELIERDGLDVKTVSVAGSHCYDLAARLSGVTEVQAGSYPLMDYTYCRVREEFSPAARVLSQVISRPTEEVAVVDAGHKAIGPDEGIPVLDGSSRASALRLSAEHGILQLEGDARQQIKPGDKLWLVPASLSLCLNQYDFIRPVRGGKLEGFWPIAARGSLQ